MLVHKIVEEQASRVCDQKHELIRRWCTWGTKVIGADASCELKQQQRWYCIALSLVVFHFFLLAQTTQIMRIQYLYILHLITKQHIYSVRVVSLHHIYNIKQQNANQFFSMYDVFQFLVKSVSSLTCSKEPKARFSLICTRKQTDTVFITITT